MLDDEKHPKSLEGMKDALIKHPWDPAWQEHQKKQKEQRRQSQQQEEQDDITLAQGHKQHKPVVCFCCGQVDHPCEQPMLSSRQNPSREMVF